MLENPSLIIANDCVSEQSHPDFFAPRNSAQLHQAFARLLANTNDYRLGSIFEMLVICLIETCPQYSNIHSRIAVYQQHAKHKQTLGELDLVFYNQTSERYEHWELAVKFYLYDAAQAPEQAWLGATKNDYLHSKILRHRQKQMPLLEHAATQQRLSELGLSQSELAEMAQYTFMRGKLFCPAQDHGGPAPLSDAAFTSALDTQLNRACARFRWLKPAQLLSEEHAQSWYCLHKPFWLVHPHYLADAQVQAKLPKLLFNEQEAVHLPQLIYNAQSHEQAFLVAEDW